MIVRGSTHADVLFLVCILMVAYFVTGIATFSTISFLNWSFFFVVPVSTCSDDQSLLSPVCLDVDPSCVLAPLSVFDLILEH